MDEHQMTVRSNSSDAASDDLSNSILGKMRKILPNSISNWLSPKVDSRRRRHDELDSDEDAEQNRSQPFGNSSSSVGPRNNNYVQIGTTAMAAAPPTKRQRIFTPTPFNTYSTPPVSVPRRESIISSTLIEDTAISSTPYRPHENGSETSRRSMDRIGALENQYRASPLAATQSSAETRSSNNELNLPPSRSQPMVLPTYRAERDLDETSSNRSTNPLLNDSMAVNFSAHLQKSKSLFSNKSYVSQSSRSLSNYRQRRQPSMSLYRSTSSLCDNNSNTSSNASSVLSSPFYNGQTTFGGASAQSKRLSSAFNSQHHRAKVPSRLVPSNLSKSTSALNVADNSSVSSTMTGLSSTAKRILEVMKQSSTPLGDVRRVSNALPTTSVSSQLSSNRRLSALLEASTDATESDHDKTKRRLLKPNTPYNRPVGRSVTESCFTQGLNVPSMPQLLQLKKKLTENTIKSRELASQSNSILNKPLDNYKLPERVTSSDLDATNNNHKSSTSANRKHVNKIRNNTISKQRKAAKGDEHEMPPESVDLPNVQLILNSAEIKFSPISFPAPKAPIIESRKIEEPVAKPRPVDAPALTFKLTPSNTIASPKPPPFASIGTNVFASTTTSTSSPVSKSNNIFGSAPLSTKPVTTASPPTPTISISSSSSSSSSSASSSPSSSPSSASSTSKSSSSSSVEIVSDSPVMKEADSPVTKEAPKSPYKFATPIYVKAAACAETDSFKVQEKQNYKFSEPIVVNAPSSASAAKPLSSKAPTTTTPMTKSPAAKSAETKKPEFSFAKQVPSTDSAQCDDTMKALAAKQKQNKWSCSSCFTPNENSATKCVCCGVANSSASSSLGVKAPISSSSGASATVDDVFKSIVAKQKQSKWACDSCMADNDVAQTKCLCCGGSKPNSGSTPAPSSIPSSSAQVDDLFKSIVAKQKSSSWTCSVCDTKNDLSKSKCVCCQQAKESDTPSANSASNATPAKSAFSFGSGGIDLGAPSGKFSFGAKPVADSEPTAPIAATSQFSFGAVKPDDTVKSTASPITFGSFKSDNAATSTATAPTAAAPNFSFGSPTTGAKPSVPLGTFAFGGAKPAVDSTSFFSSQSASKAPTFGTLPTTTSTTSSAPTTAITTAAQSSTTATPAPLVDDTFKRIVSQQTAKWSCSTCMAQNNQTDSECACCSTPKDGASVSEKKADSTVKSQFSFGTPSTSPFTFGSKPTATPSSTFQFGSPAQPSVTSSNTVTSTSSSFSVSSSQPTFGSPFAIQKTNAQSSTVTSTATTIASKQFQFGFGSSVPSFGSPKFGSLATASSDVTDAVTAFAPTVGGEPKSLAAPANAVIQPAAPSIEKPKPMFSFGAPAAAADDKPKSVSLKRPGTDVSTEPNLFKAPTLAATAPAAPLTSTSFVFGQPNSTNSSFGTSSSTNQSVAPAFSFGTPTPAFGATSAPPAAAPPVFGSALTNPPSSAFPTNAFSFGASNHTPSFGQPLQNPASTEQAPPQTGLFQLGAIANQSVVLATDAFRFDANAAPSFNFSATATQPQADANTPFQFNSAAPTNNLFAPQSTSTAVKDRRKLRPARRVNRT